MKPATYRLLRGRRNRAGSGVRTGAGEEAAGDLSPCAAAAGKAAVSAFGEKAKEGGIGTGRADVERYLREGGSAAATCVCEAYGLGPGSAACGFIADKVLGWVIGPGIDLIESIFGGGGAERQRRREDWARYRETTAAMDQLQLDLAAELHSTVSRLQRFADKLYPDQLPTKQSDVLVQLGLEGLPLVEQSGAVTDPGSSGQIIKWAPPSVSGHYRSIVNRVGFRRARDEAVLLALEWLGQLERAEMDAVLTWSAGKQASIAASEASRMKMLDGKRKKKGSSGAGAAVGLGLGAVALLALL